MKTIEKILIQVIADRTGFVPSSIEIMRDFRISENQTSFDKVFLVFAPEFNSYYVIWRWTCSKRYLCYVYPSYKSAYSFYENRKSFAVSCN